MLWSSDDGTIEAGAPAVDDAGSIYMTARTAIHKLAPGGERVGVAPLVDLWSGQLAVGKDANGDRLIVAGGTGSGGGARLVFIGPE